MPSRRITLRIGKHPAVALPRAELDEAGWIVELWSDPTSLEIYCVEMIEDYEPGLCRLLEA